MKSLVIPICMGLMASACATDSKIQGTAQDGEVSVKMNKNEFSLGDRVFIFQEKCEVKNGSDIGEKPRGNRMVCRDVKVGSGEIIKKVSDKEVILRADQNILLHEGFEVKKE